MALKPRAKALHDYVLVLVQDGRLRVSTSLGHLVEELLACVREDAGAVFAEIGRGAAAAMPKAVADAVERHVPGVGVLVEGLVGSAIVGIAGRFAARKR